MKTTVVKPGHFAKAAKTVRIPVSQLGIGMFVSELDRPWLETPFLVQGFLIETMEHIDLVQQFCEYVYIDAVEESWVGPEERGVSTNRKKRTRYVQKISMEQEHQVASGIYKQARSITKTVMDDIRLGNSLDTQKAKDTVTDCVDSILRNPDALMWLGKIQNADSHTADHCLNVCILAIAFGRYLELSEDDLNKLGLCGLLHDIGKMKVPLSVLSKGINLSEQEAKVLRNHPVYGRNILMSNPGLFHGVTDVAHSHHEYLDGSGYPRGIKAVGISPFCRMISIVDTYENITTGKPGQPAKSTLEAIRMLYANRGKLFDEQLVQQFIQCVGLFPPGSIVELMSGAVGIVLTTNYKNRRLPKVMVLLDEAKQEQPPKILNLGDPKQHGEENEHLIKDVLVNGSYGVDVQEHIRKGLILKA